LRHNANGKTDHGQRSRFLTIVPASVSFPV
jgi:hypothetical protein